MWLMRLIFNVHGNWPILWQLCCLEWGRHLDLTCAIVTERLKELDEQRAHGRYQYYQSKWRGQALDFSSTWLVTPGAHSCTFSKTICQTDISLLRCWLGADAWAFVVSPGSGTAWHQGWSSIIFLVF